MTACYKCQLTVSAESKAFCLMFATERPELFCNRLQCTESTNMGACWCPSSSFCMDSYSQFALPSEKVTLKGIRKSDSSQSADWYVIFEWWCYKTAWAHKESEWSPSSSVALYVHARTPAHARLYMSGSPGQALTSAFYTARSIKHSGFILRDYAAVCRPGDNTQHEHVQQLENKSDCVSAFNRNLCIFLLFMTCWWTDIILKQIKSLLTKPVMRFDYDLWGESKGFSCEEHLLWVQQLPLYIITVCTVQFYYPQ